MTPQEGNVRDIIASIYGGYPLTVQELHAVEMVMAAFEPVIEAAKDVGYYYGVEAVSIHSVDDAKYRRGRNAR